MGRKIKVRIRKSQLKEDIDEAKKKGKPQCVGNAKHDADGEFSSKQYNTSWSLSNREGKDCSWGQASMSPGSNQRKITKKDKRTKRCGRDKADGTSKSRYRCKDGSAVWEAQDNEDKILLDKETFDRLMGNITNAYEAHLSGIEEQLHPKEAKVKALCHRYGLKTFREFLKTMNAVELAQKGDLNKPAKENAK